jgi:hypothetical protein
MLSCYSIIVIIGLQLQSADKIKKGCNTQKLIFYKNRFIKQNHLQIENEIILNILETKNQFC